MEIGELTELRHLWLYENGMVNLPPEIGNLRNLCFLQIGNNNLDSLVPALGNLQRLATGGDCDTRIGYGLYFDNNPLISPPQEVINQGTPAILDYLRNESWWHIQRVILGGAAFTGILAAVILGFRWRNRRRKSKKRNMEKAN